MYNGTPSKFAEWMFRAADLVPFPAGESALVKLSPLWAESKESYPFVEPAFNCTDSCDPAPKLTRTWDKEFLTSRSTTHSSQMQGPPISSHDRCQEAKPWG